MRRREFITLIGSAAVAWPLAARAQAQQSSAMRRVAFLSGLAEDDPEARARAAAFRNGLEKLGWTVGRNVALEYRYSGGDGERMRAYAAELVRLKPDVLVAAATTALTALRKATRDIPVVFAQVTDPVGAGIVASLSRPGGNVTGFTQHEYSIGAKWLELLKGLAPEVKRVAVIHDADNPAAAGYLATMTAAMPAFQIQLTRFAVRNTAEIESAIEIIAATPGGGMIVLPGPVPAARRDRIIALADQRRLPAVFAFRYWVVSGGLASYGVDNIDLYRRAADYVDRILKGEKPAELPVQHATRFQTVLNLKTAKALGIEVPPAVLVRADEVIE